MRFSSTFGAVLWNFLFTAVSCGLAILQNQAVCGIQKFWGNFNAIGGFLMLFCVVVIRISERFCSICNPITPLRSGSCVSCRWKAYSSLKNCCF